MNKKKLPVPVPGEHGAWAILYASFVVGWAAAGVGLSLEIILLLATVTGFFLAHEPLVKLLRARRHGAPARNRRHWLGWLGIYLLIALASGALLLAIFHLWILAGVGLLAGVLFSLHLHLAFRRKDRNLAGELLGIMGLTLTAPAAVFAGGEAPGIHSLIVWGICILYFGSGIFYVKMRVSHHLKPAQFEGRKRQCLAYHTLLLVLLSLAAATLQVPNLVLVGFIPILVRAFWYALMPGGTLDLKKIGYREVLYTVIFTICSGVSWMVAG